MRKGSVRVTIYITKLKEKRIIYCAKNKWNQENTMKYLHQSCFEVDIIQQCLDKLMATHIRDSCCLGSAPKFRSNG